MITIAWDIDDVLNDLMRSWFEEKWLIDHPVCHMSYEELTENPPHRLLGVGIDEYLESLDKYRLSRRYQGMHPVRETEQWFLRHGNGFRHVALTAVPLVAVSASAQWVFRHFGFWIRSFHFVPSKREGQKVATYDEDKAAFLRWLGRVDVLVDDSIDNVNAAKGAGVKGILIPRPWNQGRGTVSEALALLEKI